MSTLGKQEALTEAAAGPWELLGRDMIRTVRTENGGGEIVAQFWTSPTPEHAAMMVASPTMLIALRAAESFMAGFEGDELQEGIDDRLAVVREAIAIAEGRHA